MSARVHPNYRERIFRNYLDSCSHELGLRPGADCSAVYHPAYRSHYLPLLPRDKDARILDIGCGMGNLLSFLKQQGYRRCSGIDRSPQMVQVARGRGNEVEEAEALNYLHARPNAFDCVIAMDVLEHLHKDELMEWMDAIFAALKPGGYFLAHTINADGISWGRMRYIDLTHETAFTRYSLAKLFTVAGFARCEFYPVEPIGPGLRGLIRKALWKLFRLAAGVWYHVEMGSGIIRNDHILTASLLAKTVKAPHPG